MNDRQVNVTLRAPLRGIPVPGWTRATAFFEGDEFVLRPMMLSRPIMRTWRLGRDAVKEIYRPPLLGRLGFVAVALTSGRTLGLQMGEPDDLLVPLRQRGFNVSVHS